MRSALCNNVTSSSNISGPTICSSVSRILPMHVQIVSEAKNYILSKDWISTLQDSKTHSSLAVVSATDEVASSWNRVWDEAFEYGVRGTKLMQGLFSVLSRPTFGNKSCPHCKDTIPTSYPEHLFAKHLVNYNVDTIVGWLENKNYI